MLKKIMFFIPSLEYGGAEKVTLYLATFFSKKGYRVAVTTYKRKKNREFMLDKSIRRYFFVKRKDICHIVEEFKPSLIVIMFAPMGIKVVPAIKKYRIPYIISERNDPENFSGKKITKLLYQHFMRNASGIVFQTHDAKNYYGRRLKGKKKIIYNPLLLEDFPEIFHGERNKVIVNVGRLHHQKNQKLLIQAFSKVHEEFPEYKLQIFGEGELRIELEELIKRLHLTNCVVLMGSRKDVLEYENESAMFVLSSDFEGMPNALIEAMALGIPVISTDCPCGGPRELITDHVNGTLVPVGDVNKLKDAIVELIKNKELAKKYSLEELKIRDELNEDRILGEWEKFFLTVK